MDMTDMSPMIRQRMKNLLTAKSLKKMKTQVKKKAKDRVKMKTPLKTKKKTRIKTPTAITRMKTLPVPTPHKTTFPAMPVPRPLPPSLILQ